MPFLHVIYRLAVVLRAQGRALGRERDNEELPYPVQESNALQRGMTGGNRGLVDFAVGVFISFFKNLISICYKTNVSLLSCRVVIYVDLNGF